MTSVVVPGAVARELAEIEVGEEADVYTVIARQFERESRWAKHTLLVVRLGLAFYGAEYRTGLTEMQEEVPVRGVRRTSPFTYSNRRLCPPSSGLSARR